MRWLMLILAVLLGVLICVGVCIYGQFKKLNDCPLCPLIPRIKEAPKNFTWEKFNDHQDLLREDGNPLGIYDFPSDSFTEWTGEKWGRTGLPCPICPPIKIVKLPTGLVDGKIQQGREEIRVNGKVISHDQAMMILQAPCPNCPDPPRKQPKAGKPYVVVISSMQAERDRIKLQWEQSPDFAEYREILSFWDCPPGHWSLVANLAAKDGTILVQRGDGAVLHRQETLDVGQLLEALRNTRPEYDPKKDRNAGGIGLELDALTAIGGGVLSFFLVILGVVLGGYFGGGKKS